MKHIHRLINYYKNWLIKTQPNIFNLWRFGLYQRPSSEEVCLLPLTVLATIVMRRGKKSVVRVAQCVAALVPVHRTLSLFPNTCRFFDPSSIFVRFSVQNCSHWQSLSEQKKSALTDHASHHNTWSIGQRLQFWTENRTKILFGSKKRYVFEKRDKVLWTGTRAATHSAHVRPISCHVASLSCQEPEEEVNKLLLRKVSGRDRNVKG